MISLVSSICNPGFSDYSGLAGGSLPPIGYEVDSSLAYAGRRNTCYISHTDGDNAPAS